MASPKIGDTAPDFEAETTEGRISFHDGSATPGLWFSHPKDATPMCTTELVHGEDQAGVRRVGT